MEHPFGQHRTREARAIASCTRNENNYLRCQRSSRAPIYIDASRQSPNGHDMKAIARPAASARNAGRLIHPHRPVMPLMRPVAHGRLVIVTVTGPVGRRARRAHGNHAVFEMVGDQPPIHRIGDDETDEQPPLTSRTRSAATQGCPWMRRAP